MNRFTWTPEVHRYADNRVRVWSLKVLSVRGPRFVVREELEDIGSEIWVDLLTRMERYNAQRSSVHTFIGHVVRNKALDMIASWNEGKERHRRRTISLNESVADESGESVERQDLLTSDEHRRAWTGDMRTAEDRLVDRIDLTWLLRDLSDEPRTLCRRLASESVAEIARSRGVSRDVIYEEIREIRRVIRRGR